MTVQNLPIQVIAHCDAEGTLRPLRFRYEDEQQQYHTVYVDKITDTRKVDYVAWRRCCICAREEWTTGITCLS